MQHARRFPDGVLLQSGGIIHVISNGIKNPVCRVKNKRRRPSRVASCKKRAKYDFTKRIQQAMHAF
jgi:hypothetical protein